MADEKECLNCGKGFIPTCHITRQKFCSDACRNRYHSAKGHYGVPVNICPECGDKVEQNGGPGRWRRFCSDRCREKYHQKKVAEQRANREHPKQICPNCGKEYEPQWAGGTRRFCSDGCRIEWWREYHKANPPEDNVMAQARDTLPGVGLYLFHIPDKQQKKNDLTIHCIIGERAVYEHKVDSVSCMEWINDAVHGKICSYGIN